MPLCTRNIIAKEQIVSKQRKCITLSYIVDMESNDFLLKQYIFSIFAFLFHKSLQFMSPGTARRLHYPCCRFLTLFKFKLQGFILQIPPRPSGVHNRNCYILRGWIMHNSKISPNNVFYSCPFKALIFVSFNCFFFYISFYLYTQNVVSLSVGFHAPLHTNFPFIQSDQEFCTVSEIYSPSPSKNSDFLTFAR